jgi:hypothetical protein
LEKLGLVRGTPARENEPRPGATTPNHGLSLRLPLFAFSFSLAAADKLYNMTHTTLRSLRLISIAVVAGLLLSAIVAL